MKGNDNMKMTNAAAVNNLTNLVGIVKRDITLPAKVSYAISRNVRKLEEELKDYFDTRNKTIMELGTKDKDGNTSISTEDREKIEEYTRRMSDIESSEIEVDIFKIKIDDLSGDYPVSVITGMEFMIE